MKKLVKARVKKRIDFPPAEHCCDAVKSEQEKSAGQLMTVDLGDVIPYSHIVGHCGQKLNYEKAFRVIGTTSYVPLELLDLDEGLIADEIN